VLGNEPGGALAQVGILAVPTGPGVEDEPDFHRQQGRVIGRGRGLHGLKL